MARRSFGFGTLQVSAGADRVVIVIPKKIARTAVLRNKIRRRIRHALPRGTRGVTLFPHATVATLPFTELKRALAEVLASR